MDTEQLFGSALLIMPGDMENKGKVRQSPKE
jgi:hypothetical protein